MAERDRKGGIVRATERPEPWSYSHPLNPNSDVRGQSLSPLCGMERINVHLVRIPAGKEAYVYHSHTAEEECFFIVSGRGVAEIDGSEHEIGPGDFLGFGTPSVAHQIRNPFDEDLVYLVAGERAPMEFAAYPKMRKSVIRLSDAAHIVDDDDMETFWRK